MSIEKIRKYRALRHANLTKVTNEVSEIRKTITSPCDWQHSRHRIHIVPVDGIEFIVADAISLSRHAHQRGRGPYRYLFCKQTKNYAGLAREVDNGQYRAIA